jgi:hypothetical protein
MSLNGDRLMLKFGGLKCRNNIENRFMIVRQPRYSKEEFAQRGDEIYDRIRPEVEAGNHGKIVSIDIETGAYEVADDILTSTDRLFELYPDAQPWIVRIGYRAVHRFGARSLRKFQ